VQDGELGPEHRPEGCRSGGERQGHPSPRDHQPGACAQNPLAQAAQAPARSGRLCHGPASDVHDLIRQTGDEQGEILMWLCILLNSVQILPPQPNLLNLSDT
jgi:hypothetical protein